MDKIRIYLTIVVLTLSFLDLFSTYLYVKSYKSWQPNKPFNLIENNPLLVFLWNKFGLTLGMIIGSVVILSLLFIICTDSHWIFPVILLIILFRLGKQSLDNSHVFYCRTSN